MGSISWSTGSITASTTAGSTITFFFALLLGTTPAASLAAAASLFFSVFSYYISAAATLEMRLASSLAMTAGLVRKKISSAVEHQAVFVFVVLAPLVEAEYLEIHLFQLAVFFYQSA